ncbi:ectoine/hydroxyectoine ABC transporter substrate-binding protein EhuB [Rhabdothermincola salaria]|uniref:ectoine/hydroxyectoine ABC transporter substrate-binding protein EhuB n=1 Tax=Rhabdothermincola salaria TaxID=2903142 RepID=UPI001E62203A|nr:ectoine/hydroxyectoine ABC transporter substrate-binding protein EhuB [Rhabdothermincola salaria]MCD9624053.1 ectoine/hydroxyectoine ABC transporter substrate-binding protein EhuB [Rhabdothermincola salaria]
MALLLAACGSDDGDDEAGGGGGGSDDCTASDEVMGEEGGLLAGLQDAGSVEVGIANEVPYGYEDESGNVTGEAPEVARAVLCELGIGSISAEVVDFGNLIPGLQAGQFDMIAAGMFINAERAEQILFSDPDYCVSESLLVPEGNPDNLSDYQSIIDSGVTVAVLQGAVEEGYLETAGVPDSQIELFGDVNQQYDALAADRVDAVTGTYLTVQTQADAMDGFEAVDGFFPLDENGEEILGCGGFGFADEEFRDAFNLKLDELQEDGTVMEIVTGFGFAEADVEAAADLTVSDLTS